MAGQPRLLRLHLKSFKSHRNQTFEIHPLSLLIGPNGGGKSNVLDALSMLALLSDGRDIHDLDRGDLEVAGLRGGLAGAAPYGAQKISVGCDIAVSSGEVANYTLEIETGKQSEIVRESLVLRGSGRPKVLLDAHPREPGSGISDASVYSGYNPKVYAFLSTRLGVTQVPTKVAADSQGRRLAIRVASELVSLLNGIFVLDPVPAEMRKYVRIGTPPDRTASSLSATIDGLRQDKETWDRLNNLVRDLVDAPVREISFFHGGPSAEQAVDVQVALTELVAGKRVKVPATNLSDGTLRYLAIVASLLRFSTSSEGSAGDAQRTMVLEEIENGLFPSQGKRMLSLLREEAASTRVNLIATTHSPALLDAVEVTDHVGISICERDADGWSVITPLLKHPRYIALAATGELGRSVTEGVLTEERSDKRFDWADIF